MCAFTTGNVSGGWKLTATQAKFTHNKTAVFAQSHKSCQVLLSKVCTSVGKSLCQLVSRPGRSNKSALVFTFLHKRNWSRKPHGMSRGVNPLLFPCHEIAFRKGLSFCTQENFVLLWHVFVCVFLCLVLSSSTSTEKFFSRITLDRCNNSCLLSESTQSAVYLTNGGCMKPTKRKSTGGSGPLVLLATGRRCVMWLDVIAMCARRTAVGHRCLGTSP